MKTMFIVTSDRLANHAGEEYDEWIELPPMTPPEDLPAVANQIRNKIRGLFVESQKEGDFGQRDVQVIFDASPHYGVILVSIQDAMREDEGINLILPECFSRDSKPDSVNID